jgi:hypothetical protein
MRRLFATLVLAVFHLAASIFFVANAFMDAMSRFEMGGPESAGQKITVVMARILTFPLVWLLDWFPDARESSQAVTVAIVCANSLLWGAAVYAGFSRGSRWVKARRAREGTSPSSNP